MREDSVLIIFTAGCLPKMPDEADKSSAETKSKKPDAEGKDRTGKPGAPNESGDTKSKEEQGKISSDSSYTREVY